MRAQFNLDLSGLSRYVRAGGGVESGWYTTNDLRAGIPRLLRETRGATLARIFHRTIVVRTCRLRYLERYLSLKYQSGKFFNGQPDAAEVLAFFPSTQMRAKGGQRKYRKQEERAARE